MNVVILGGTGYIGRAVTRKFLEFDQNIQVITVSRKGENSLKDPRITNVKADCTDANAIIAVIPMDIDIIVDLVGGMGDPAENIEPAKATVIVADTLNIPKIGYVGGSLGSKSFLESKKEAMRILLDAKRQVVFVNPTLVYGDGRNDALAKMVPLMKFLGLFSKKFKPVTVDEVAEKLVCDLLK